MTEYFNINFIIDLWNIPGELKFVRKMANWAYYSPEKNVYFRITSNEHRSIDQITAELNWIKHLTLDNIKAIQPVLSKNNNLIESALFNNQLFHIVCFTAAEGKRENLEESKEDFYINWGKLTGQLHKSTKSYQNPKSRPGWYEDEYHQNIILQRKSTDGLIYKKSLELEEKFHNLPLDLESFGLIHADLHTGNFNIDTNGKITLFDFDDCVQHWFIYDIAIVFWNLSFYKLNENFAKENFLKGYFKENFLDKFWFEHLEDFYAYRVILIYYFAKREIAASGFNPKIVENFNACINSANDYFK
jgi:amicoumacin kinase